MIVKKYTKRTKIDYRDTPFNSASNRNRIFNNDLSALDKYIRFQLESEYIRIGYDPETCNDLFNDDIKYLLYKGSSLRRELIWERNVWYLYKYESSKKLLKALKIHSNHNFQISVKPRLIEIKKIYTSEIKHSGYENVDKYGNYKFPTRIFRYRLFNIVPVTVKEFDKLKNIRQPFQIRYNAVIPLP